MKPDPMPAADGRDANPYLARMVFAGGLGLAVGGLRRRTSRDAGPYPGADGRDAHPYLVRVKKGGGRP